MHLWVINFSTKLPLTIVRESSKANQKRLSQPLIMQLKPNYHTRDHTHLQIEFNRRKNAMNKTNLNNWICNHAVKQNRANANGKSDFSCKVYFSVSHVPTACGWALCKKKCGGKLFFQNGVPSFRTRSQPKHMPFCIPSLKRQIYRRICDRWMIAR